MNRILLSALLGGAAAAIAVFAVVQNVHAAAQGTKAEGPDAIANNVRAFLSSLGETTKRAELISKMCEGGPIEGLKPNQDKIAEFANSEVTRYGLPVGGADSVVVAEEKVISTFLVARTYVVRCERGPSVWHALLYNGAKGWGVHELGIAPNSHCLINSWRDVNYLPVMRPSTPQGQPANAGGNR